VTGVLIASAILVSSFLSPQGSPPTNLQAEQATNPSAVDDNRPDFRAQNNLGQAATRYQLQVTNQTDPTFAAPIWSSPGPNGGTNFPGNVSVSNGAMSPEIAFGQGGNLLTMLLDWNKTYFWRAKFGNSSVWNSAFSATNQFTMAAPNIQISAQSNNGAPVGSSWRFIGVPIAFGTTVPATELLTEVPTLYRLDEPTRTWILMGPGDVLEAGRGYMGYCTEGAILTLSQGKVTAGIPAVKDNTGATTTPSYTLTNNFSLTILGAPTGQEITDGVPANTYAGNALFANPFYAPISWTSSTTPPAGFGFGHVARTNISYAMYKWDGTQYLTYNGVTGVGTAGEWISPFQAVGIWVQATPYQLWVDTPAPMTGGPQKAITAHAVSVTPDPDSWHLMMEARSGTSIDTENAFGIHPQADDACDIRDSEEPGPGGPTWVLVSFDHRSDWTTFPRKYTHDFRKTRYKAGEQVVWTFTVDGNTNLPATLTWPNLSDIPATDWKFTLEDPATSATVDLSSASSYDTLPVTGPSTMTLRATRLMDSPTLAPASNGGGGGSGNCGLLGPEGLLLLGWILARRGARLRRTR